MAQTTITEDVNNTITFTHEDGNDSLGIQNHIIDSVDAFNWNGGNQALGADRNEVLL